MNYSLQTQSRTLTNKTEIHTSYKGRKIGKGQSSVIDLTRRFSNKKELIHTPPTSMTQVKTCLLASPHQKYLPALELQVMVGGHRGERFVIQPGRHQIGRSSKADISLRDASVSNFHATLDYKEDGKVTLYDAASRNGISVDGKAAPIVTAKIGRIIQIGGVYIRLIRKEKRRSLLAKRESMLIGIALVSIVSALLLAGRRSSAAKENKTPTTIVETASVSVPFKGPLQASRAQKRKGQKARRRSRMRASGRSNTFAPKPTRLAQARSRFTPETIERRARDSFDAGDYPAAFILWRDLFQVRPGNDEAIAGLSALHAVAAQLYEEALMTSPKDATEMLKMIVKITKGDDDYHKRAKEELAQRRRR